MPAPDLLLFALTGSQPLGERVARALGIELAELEERDFEDGEHKTRPLVGVRGRDVYVLHSLYSDERLTVNDKLCRLLFFIGALRDAGAGRITAVVPYLAYARKDRQTQPRDPVTTRYVAGLFESVHADRVVTVDVHELAAYQNAFRIDHEHLEARPLFVRHFAELLADEPVAVASPDVGGFKRCEALRRTLGAALGRELPGAFMEKRRSEGVVSGDLQAGEVEGRTVLVVDDLVASGTTLVRAAEAFLARGATRVLAAVTHGVFTRGAEAALARAALQSLTITDTVDRLAMLGDGRRGVVVLEIAPLLAQAVERLHGGGSLTELVEP